MFYILSDGNKDKKLLETKDYSKVKDYVLKHNLYGKVDLCEPDEEDEELYDIVDTWYLWVEKGKIR